jgi:uncharacterized cupredoxin-like copper-binding protein
LFSILGDFIMSKILNAAAIIAITVAAAAVPPTAWAKKNSLDIELREWNVSLSTETVQAGELDVTIKNKGKETHELVFIKLNTDLATGRFPVDKDGGIDEDRMSFGTLVDEAEGLDPGKKVKMTVKLKPGRYAIVCNMKEQEDSGSIEAHYSMGMHAQLNVE